ncbi:MAG: SusD/RagB family nutrient-binding outer membrane lipoprotein [Bacteroidetes bacterium CHB5]|nr:SusD/RagB family nutrient-binding outer membrane lipoprotein [Bacteroidetes bacterium CHB5]
MKKFQKKGSLMLVIAMLFTVSSCDLFDLDINTDPNNPSQASLELLLTNVMLDASSTFAGGLNNATSGFLGHTTSTDDHNMNNTSWNGTWNFLYSGPLNDLERIIRAATEQGNNPHYLAVAQILKAYYFSLMVDLWGDIPYTEAFQGDQGNKAPVYDDQAAIYADLIQLCDDAVANIALTSPVRVLGDVIYNNGGTGVSAATQMGRWRRAAKSLKLRLLLQTSRVDASAAAKIQALVDEGDLILTPANDFQFKFGVLQNPDDRHPWYQSGYSGGEAGFSYYGHQFMYEMLLNGDPRTPFYFHRQTEDILDPADPTDKQTIPCSQRTDCTYGYFVLNGNITNALFNRDPDALTSSQAEYLAGYFGRDRADPSGIPNDNPLRTTVGAYPAAGVWDGAAAAGGGNKGRGDGIFPMITSWMMNFYLLEAQISLGVVTGKTDDALLRDALNQQIDKVFSLGASVGGNTDPSTWTFPIAYKTKADFVNEVVAAYPIAGTEGAKLQYALKQAWFANHGNGFELYNTFRRTGFPSDLQAPLQAPRQFALSLPYVQDELNLNPKTPTKVYDSPSDAIFWDVIKYQF